MNTAQTKDTHAGSLLTAISRNDKAAFERLFRENYTPLCAYAESLLHEPADAEDLVQGIFCDLWERRSRLAPSDPTLSASTTTSIPATPPAPADRAYLFRAVRNAALNFLKHQKVELEFARFVIERGTQSENNTELYFLRENQSALLDELHRAIDTLPAQCREIFLLSRFSGKKSADIAASLHLSVRTVETQLYRALRQLRTRLSHLRNSELLLFLAIPRLTRR